jgi:hypothetical protein
MSGRGLRVQEKTQLYNFGPSQLRPGREIDRACHTLDLATAEYVAERGSFAVPTMAIISAVVEEFDVGAIAELSPSVVQARLRFLANFLSDGRVIGIAFRAAAVVSGRIVSIEFCVLAKSLRQIRVSQKLAPESD